MLVKLTLFGTIIFETIFLCWELRHFKAMKKLAQEGYKQADEGTRRRVWGGKGAFTAVASMSIFMLLLLLGVLVSDGRECKPGFAAENAVCVPCRDTYCLECAEGSNQCSRCADTFLINNKGQC